MSGMVFDGHDLEALLRVNPTRRLAPPVTDQTVEVPGRPGEVFMRQQLNALALPVHVELRGRMRDHRDLAAARRLITSLLVRDEPCRLTLPDEPGLSYEAKLTDAGELDTLWDTGEADLTFTAYDPIAYGQARRATLADGTTQVETGGTWPSSPVLTLTATGSGYVRVTDVGSGRYVLLAQSAASGATVAIDMAAQTAKVVDLKAAGFDAEGVGEGDGVAIVDECFDPTLRLAGRVLAMTVDYLAPENDEITLGSIRDVTDTMAEWQAQIGGLSSHSATWDAAGSVTTSYIAAVVRQLNEQFSAGGSYKFESFEQGSIWASVPLDEDGKPTETPAMAIQLCGQGFRIASSVDEDGEFEWTTFGTGDGFVADCITTGTLNASLVNTGVLKVTNGEDTLLYVDFDSGIVELSAYSTTEEVDAAITAKANEISLAVEGAKVHYCECYTYSDEQLKVAVCDDFKATVGAIVCVTFMWANIQDMPELIVMNAENEDDATEAARGYILVGADYMTDVYFWSDSDVLSLMWDGTYWRVADGYSRSAVEVLRDSITLSVGSSAGGRASIVLSVGGETHTTGSVVTGARESFAAESTAITITAGTVTFNSNTFVVNSTYFKVTSAGVITATSGTIGGFTIGTASIYSGKTSLTSNTSGVYVGTDGISVGSGTQYMALADGFIRGGSATTYTGYMDFSSYNGNTGVYGLRLGGKGSIALLTDGFLGIAEYYEKDADVTTTTGISTTIRVITSLSATWTNYNLSGTYNISNICTGLSINWVWKDITFIKGLMVTT